MSKGATKVYGRTDERTPDQGITRALRPLVSKANKIRSWLWPIVTNVRYNNNDIQQQINIKNSLDPSSLLNPGKVYPILRKCAEEGRLHIHGRDKSKFSDIPRF